MSRSWVRLSNMSARGNLQQPLLPDVPEDGVSPSPPRSPPQQQEQQQPREEDLVERSRLSAASLPCDIVVPVLGNKQETSVEVLSPCGSPEGSIHRDNSKKKKLVWADRLDGSRDVASDGVGRPSSHFGLRGDGGERPQSYILYEGREEEGESFIHVQRDRSRSSFAGNSIVSEGDITEDQFTYKTDFMKVEVPSSNPDGSSMTTAQELQICKKTVLKPYIIFLKVIGWRSFYSSRQDLSSARWVKVLNIVYPAILFSLMALSCITQILTCFYRDQPVHDISRFRNGVLVIDCSADLITRLIIPDILLLGAYLWGIYVFRFGAPEHLISLVETVFLGSQHVRNGQAKMVNFMRLIMLGGVFWLCFDIVITVCRVFSLQLLEPHSFLTFLIEGDSKNLTNESDHTSKEEALRWSFVIFDFVGFIFFDLLYIAVIISYTSQCQLLRLYIGTIIDRVLTKLQGYTLEQAMTDINQTYQFLKVVNGKLSVLTSICLIVFLEAAISSLYTVFQLDIRGRDRRDRVILGLVVGLCNSILWSIIALVPIVQAARLTSRCQQLRRLGLSVGHRPFAYHNTHQLLLDSFVQYTNVTRYRAKLAGVPIYPSYVIGGLFVFIIVGSLLILVVPGITLLPWL